MSTARAARSTTDLRLVAALLASALLLALAAMPGGLGGGFNIVPILLGVLGFAISYMGALGFAVYRAFSDGPRRKFWRGVAIVMLLGIVAVGVLVAS